ncbi:MAG: sigma-54-dependent Fis family transcriptional regulator [Candidatus Rokubacteria bacterium]|nr:sigma-54-dependent Fis family transcriptional regulator [Candidatus Rokubacteria bacterium]
MEAPRILLVDNDAEMVRLLERQFQAEGWSVLGVTSGAQAVEALGADDFDVILTDLVMDGMDGLDLLREAQRRDPAPKVILMTAFGSLETAIEAIRAGAYDYITKPFKLPEAVLAVTRALDDRRLREENRRLRAEVEQRFAFDNIIGRSRAMQGVFEQIKMVAGSDASVLLLGESGTGKELVARAIHHNSLRKHGPFIPVNCAAIPETLLESELFGHEKGAFTGADRKRRGLFVEADGGTLLLDEIGDVPPALQAKLLRVLQDKAVRPVGASQEIHVDLRLISATHRDLLALIPEGKFREDLYYRLAVLPLRLPSLRERGDDILLLADHFLRRTSAELGKTIEGFDDEAREWLLRHRWPGNVRELENVVTRAATLARGNRVTRGDLQTEFAAVTGGETAWPTLAELQEQYMRRVLEHTKGDKPTAAKILGVSVRTLQRRDE